MRLHLGRVLGILSVCLIVATEAKAQEGLGSGSQAPGPDSTLWRDVPVGDSSRGVESASAASGAGGLGVGPTARGMIAGVQAPEVASAEILATAQQQRSMGSSKALMIVGGAAFLAGLIIGDDVGSVLAVGGAVVGLYGLYKYVQ